MKNFTILVAVSAAFGFAACSSLSDESRPVRERSRILMIDTGVANVYAIQGTRTILVDTSAPGKAGDIEEELQEHGIKPQDLALIVLTHGHGDHAGNAKHFHDAYGVPLAGGRGDLGMFAAGQNRELVPTGMMGRLVKPFVDYRYAPFTPNIVVERDLDLRPYGVAGSVRALDGHTDGSLVVLLDTKEALIGDLTRGSIHAAHQPTEHFFHEHRDRVNAQIGGLVNEGYLLFYTGHFGPVDAPALRAEFGS